MKRLLLLFVALMALTMVQAGPITRQQALQQAVQFVKSLGGNQQLEAVAERAKLAPRRQGVSQDEAYYVFNRGQNEGFVIISGDDLTPAVLGYTDSGSFDYSQIPDNMKSLLAEYENQIDHLRQQGASARRVPLAEKHPKVPQLMTSKWNQGNPYNQNCPNYFSLGKSVTGCVATAMAQVMYYQRDKSTDRTLAAIPAYTAPTKHEIYGQLHVDGIPEGAPIDWANMRDSYNGSESAVQREAVANLMLYCGVSVQMDYTNSASGAYSYRVADALKAYFGYGSSVQYIQQSSYSNDQWDEVLYNELANGRAFYLSGANSEAGHAFVCDGYDGDRRYHINWGWGGQSDGYFLLSNLSPGSQGIGGSSDGYNSGVEAIIGMEPENFSDMAINFSDSRVRVLCVANWDTNGDGKFSYGEAAEVKDLGTVFQGQTIRNFKELRQFTGLTAIADDAFSDCTSLANITLPQGIKSIGARAFSGCRALTALALPESVAAIGEEAFNGCKMLAAMTLPEGLTAVENGTFENCAAITQMNLPASVKRLGNRAFAGAAKLAAFRVNNSNPANIALGTDVFSGMPLSTAILTVEQGGKALFAKADQWKEFGVIREYRSVPTPTFSAMQTDRLVYIYNVGTGRYLTKGEAWGTQAIVGDEPMRYIVKRSASMPEGTYYLYSDDTPNSNKVLFRTSTDTNVGSGVKACFVDGILRENAYWVIKSVGNDHYTLQPPSSSADYADGLYLGVLTSHASNAAKPTYGAYYDIKYVGNEEACQWAFVDIDAVYGTYEAAQKLEELLELANARNMETQQEQAVLDNMESTLAELENAQRKLRRKLGFIHFEDPTVRTICAENFDYDANGEISTAEAAIVTDFGLAFNNSWIESFDELDYFVHLSTIGSFAFGECPNLKKITVPDAVTSVRSYAFSNSVAMTEVSLPQYVSSIGNSAFAGCTSLRTFSIAVSDPAYVTVTSNAFQGVNLSAATLYVPQGSRELYANAAVWKNFGQIKEMRALGEPVFSEVIDGQLGYIYNIGTRRYLTAGEAYGTQAVVGTQPTLYALHPSGTGDDIWYLQAYETGNSSNILFRTDTDSKVGTGVKACFVDGALSAKAYWKVQLVGDNIFTLQVPETDASYVEGQYLGTQSNHESSYARPTSGVYYDVEYATKPENCQWGFVPRVALEDAKAALEHAKELKWLLDRANERGIDATSEQAVYDNLESSNQQIDDAIASLREKLHYISFDHYAAQTVCVNNWDDDGDYELSLEEAAAVKSIGTAFRRASMTSVDELRYFTSITEIPENAFANCSQLVSLYIPANVTLIDKNAFSSCGNLKYVALPNATAQPISASSSSIPRAATMFVPAAAMEAYAADEYWSRFSYEEFTGKPTVVATDLSRQYGRTIGYKFEVKGAPVNGKPDVYSEVDQTTPVGEYALEVYPGTITTNGVTYVPGVLTIEPASVTVTAQSYTRQYGQPNPEFEVTYRTFRNREKAEDVLLKEPVIECDATETSPAGEYEIRVSGAEAQNYVFEYVSGVLTIENDPTGIDVLQNDDAPTAVYDLQGRKVANGQWSKVKGELPKGIYVVGGKKMVQTKK